MLLININNYIENTSNIVNNFETCTSFQVLEAMIYYKLSTG